MNLLGTDLVVLSACNTGQGKVSGEGVFGLQRAFKKAGARSLLVSLTEVDDEVTNRLMVSFYRHLTGGCSKREALRKAQDEIRDSDWKSFILID
jgi:CHAT domain-containing protein